MANEDVDREESRRFVQETLGPRSSHPDMMVAQKRRLMLLGLLPFVLGCALVVLVLTNYQPKDFSCVRDWRTFVAACGALWGKVKLSAIILIMAGCASAGYAVTLNVLWLVGMVLKKKNVSEKDRMPFPVWLIVCIALFWLVPAGFWLARDFFSAIDWRLNFVLQLVANLLCVLPLAALLAWTRYVGRLEPKPDEEVRHPIGHLLMAIVLLAASVVVWSMPRPDFFDRIMDSHLGWVSQCGIGLGKAYGWVQAVLGLVLVVWGVFHLLCWRLKTNIRPKKDKVQPKDRIREIRNKKVAQGGVPTCAQYLLDNLPAGVTADSTGPGGKMVYRRSVGETSNNASAKEMKYGLEFLMENTPTQDQASFFTRYVEAFDQARDEFVKRINFKDGEKRSDILLLGEDGTGRTEVLLAAALYAVVVRGQRGLYLCADAEECERLSARVSKRLEWLGVDIYLSAGALDMLAVEAWIDPKSDISPPDLLFAVPEDVERAFFANSATRNPDKAKATRELLTGFGAVFVDDFLDMPMMSRAHTAFLLDKLKLLHAAEPILSQFAVAASPLQSSYERELGLRLFGESGFDPENNVKILKPRPCGDYWFGRLRVLREARDEKGNTLSLEDAARKLSGTLSAAGFQVLFYQKGMSGPAKNDFLEKMAPEVRGKVHVASRYRELAELSETPDNVFYLSLASGDAGAALRLNIDGGDPVFFQICMEGERVTETPPQYGLLPDESAKSLKVYHLRNVLQFIDERRPVPEEAWARFHIRMEGTPTLTIGHDSCAVAVSWMYDAFVDEHYGADELGAYLTLEALAAYLARGSVNFNRLPMERGDVGRDADNLGRLVLTEIAGEGDDQQSRYLAKWCGKSGTIGETDLSHCDTLVYVGRDEWTAEDVLSPDPKSPDSQRYAVQIVGQLRHGGDTEFIHPVRRLSWKVRRGCLRIEKPSRVSDSAHFQVRDAALSTCRIEGVLCGRLNLRGEAETLGEELSYSYEAYLSCWVLLPMPLDAGDTEAHRAERCLDGAWGTTEESGFSSVLTHALTAALRRKIADWSFFAVTPVFWTEGRADSVGRATMWFVEPANSGRVVQPHLRRLLKEDPTFRQALYQDALETLRGCQTLEELRMESGIAFGGECLDEEDRRKAEGLLELLLNRDRAVDWENQTRKEREENRKKRAEAKNCRHRLDEMYTPEEADFDRVVVSALMQFRETIDVSRFATQYGWDCDRINDMFDDVIWNHPEIFWVAKHCRYQYSLGSDGKLTRFVFVDLDYAFAKEDLPRKKAEFDNAVADALATIPTGSDFVEKALRLHDYIVRICDYDTEAAKNDDSSPLARTAYSVLVRHSAVCKGYAMAYRYLLDRVGIRSEEVVSDKMNHCWNYVFLNGHWYHVDVTWDDMGKKNGGQDDAIHKYFLLSDEAIQKRGHDDWLVRGLPPATDTWYDDFTWGDDGQTTFGNKTKTVVGNSLEKYRGHVAFMAQNQGCSLYCRGKIVLRVFFVDDVESCWTDEARMQFKRMVSLSVDKLLADSKCDGVSMEFLAVYADKSVSRAVEPPEAARPWIDEIFGTSGIVEDQGRFRTAIECDESPIIFAFNKEFRSCAHMSEGQPNVGRNHPEWSMVSYQQSEGERVTVHTIVHELLHQFGAPDLYYPKTVTEAAEKCLGESIMNRGMAIDDLTRVSIGWRDKLTDKAIAFLEATKGVTEAQVIKARREEWKKRWHGG